MAQAAQAFEEAMAESLLGGMRDATAQPMPGDDKLNVTFRLHPVADRPLTKETGVLTFVDREYIRIIVPGDRDLITDREATERDKQRFPRQYAAFKIRGMDAQVGMPLKLMAECKPPLLTLGQVETLAYMHVKTVEQLAGITDGNAQKLIGGQGLKQAAQRFLDAAKAAAPTQQLRTELESRDAEIAALKQALAQQGAAIAKLTGGAPAVQDPDPLSGTMATMLSASERDPASAVVALAESIPDAPKRRGRPPKVKPEVQS